MWPRFGWIALVLLFSIGASAASAQSLTDFHEHLAGDSAEQSLMSSPIATAFKATQATEDEIDLIQMEEDCRRIFPGTHYDPETEGCKSDWDGDYQNPEGSLFDIWPLGFDRDPGMPAYDDLLAGKKYLLIHHENPGWDPDHDIETWEILHFGGNGFMERRLFTQPTASWDDPNDYIQVLERWETGEWQGESDAGTPIMRVIIYSFTVGSRTHTGFSVPRFHFYDASMAGELLLSQAMRLKLPLSVEGDDIAAPMRNEISVQAITDIELLQTDPESVVHPRHWGAIKAAAN